ncbi:MAG: PfkB family carbohydrate kinase, partial [Burkholderiales bacterium]
SVAQLGGDEFEAQIVSSVGNDELGLRAVKSLKAHGVNTENVSSIDYPTGQVLVTLDTHGHASYEFASNTAWDNVAWSDMLQTLTARADAVCYGTLGQRSNISRQTIQDFVRATRPDCLRILDVNLRAAFWNEEILLQSLELANVLKLNDSELPVLADMLSYTGSDEDLLDKIARRFSLRLVALTRGANGALLMSSLGEYSELPGQSLEVVDTVGAGDAYTAVLAIGMLRGLPLPTINAWGIRVAGFVCTQAGATPHFPSTLRHVESEVK